ISPGDLLPVAALAQEAEAHFLQPRGAMLDLGLVIGQLVEDGRLALGAFLDGEADSGLERCFDAPAAGRERRRPETNGQQNRNAIHQRRSGNWQLRSCSTKVRKLVLSGDCSTR